MENTYESQVDKFQKILELVRAGWTQKSLAVDENDDAVRVLNPDAVAYSLIGAISKAQDDGAHYECMYYGSFQLLALWNDHKDTTQEEVMEFMRRVVEVAERVEVMKKRIRTESFIDWNTPIEEVRRQLIPEDERGPSDEELDALWGQK